MFQKKISIMLIFILCPLFAFAWERVPVTLEFKGGGELYTSFYCFNEPSEGKQIAEEIFHIEKYEELAKGTREKMFPVPLGTRVNLYDWAIFCYDAEFWLFEVKTGWLWGRGMLLTFPRN